MTRWILLAGGILSGTAVLVGAFGAHALKEMLDANALGWVQTGARYQTSQALALIACGLLPQSKLISLSAALFIVGIALFSGSLYVMAITGITLLGIVTPIGGVCLIGAWVSFCIAVWKR